MNIIYTDHSDLNLWLHKMCPVMSFSISFGNRHTNMESLEVAMTPLVRYVASMVGPKVGMAIITAETRGHKLWQHRS